MHRLSLYVAGLVALVVAVLPASVVARQAPEIPLVPGLTITFAVHVPDGGPAAKGVVQGDYELVVEVNSVAGDAIGLSTRVEGQDAAGKPVNVTISRRVSRQDLASARLQILGFHTSDPPEITGSTALGPSLAILRDLRTAGSASFSVQNFRYLSTSVGTLARAGAPVNFPVLINGARAELPAIRATGQLKYGNNVRPWEYLLLDHPQLPLTLHFANGAVGAPIPFAPETTRDIVRIDFPTEDRRLERSLTESCRVEVPGIYFDFNQATLNPLSRSALSDIAALLVRQASWRVAIEGHTDNVGTDAYNQDLSTRRAAAVKDALVADFKVLATRLTTSGFGESRPRETNDTIAGRARNRRVELVRECAK